MSGWQASPLDQRLVVDGPRAVNLDTFEVGPGRVTPGPGPA
jgi:hypothetical protein